MTRPHTPPYPVVPERGTPRLPTRVASPAGDDRTWTAQMGLRMRRLLWLKAISISVFMWAFFVAYFHLLRHPAYPIIEMPLTALDRAITFQPAALVPYVSLWLYVGIAPGLLLSFRQLVVYGLWNAVLCLTGMAFFYFIPTAVPPLVQGPDLATHPAFAMLQGVDAAGNACPSLHVATAMFAAIWVNHLLRGVGAPRLLRALSAAWFVLIVYSTLAIKQHVVLDVLAGLLLGMVFAWGSLRWRPADPRA
jgi:membrane-associated phospholipid phosphatase